MTDSMLIELMGDIDATLLGDSYMEQDLERMEKSWISSIVRRAKQAKAGMPGRDGLPKSVNFQDGVDKMKKKANAAAGFLYGALTMALVAAGFFALFGKKQV